MKNLALYNFADLEDSPYPELQPDSVSNLDINQLVLENQDFLKRFIMKRTWDKQAVEDVFQSTMLELLKSYHTFQGDSLPRTWMCGVAMNMIKTHAKKSNSSKFSTLEDMEESSMVGVFSERDCEDPADLHERDEWMNQALSAFERLPNEMRITFNEVINNGKTYEEVANLLGVPVGTVRSRISRARDILRKSVSY